MKNVFGNNLAAAREGKYHLDGECFVTHRVSESLCRELEELEQTLKQLQKKELQPLPLRVLRWFAFFAFVIIAGSLLLLGTSLPQAYSESPALFYLGGAAFLVWLLLEAGALLRRFCIERAPSSAALLKRQQELMKAAHAELKLPADTCSVDVLAYAYHRDSQGKERPAFKGFDYLNFPTELYRRGRMLCIATLEEEYAFPLADLTGLLEVKKRIVVPQWNKKEPVNAAAYKPFKLRVSNGLVTVRGYYSLRIHADAGEFEVLFPNYDRDAVLQCTGLKPSEAT